MRWHEIVNELKQALPLRATAMTGRPSVVRKAQPLIPAIPSQPDPVTALAQGLQPIVGQVVQQAVAQDDAEEQAMMAKAVQQQSKAQNTEQLETIKSRANTDKNSARKLIKQKYSTGAK